MAKFLKNNFPEIEVRASVNMEIGTPDGVDYLARYFDAFYVKREYNWDFHRLAEFRARCVGLGKKTYILANSGCLNFCSARTFHDNLVAHQNEISAKDNAYQFSGICHEFLSDKSARSIYPKLDFLPSQTGYAPCLCGKKCDFACYKHLKEIDAI